MTLTIDVTAMKLICDVYDGIVSFLKLSSLPFRLTA